MVLVAFTLGLVIAAGYTAIGHRLERLRLEGQLQVERQRVELLMDRVQARSVQEYRNLAAERAVAADRGGASGRWVHSNDGLQSVFVADEGLG